MYCIVCTYVCDCCYILLKWWFESIVSLVSNKNNHQLEPYTEYVLIVCVCWVLCDQLDSGCSVGIKLGQSVSELFVLFSFTPFSLFKNLFSSSVPPAAASDISWLLFKSHRVIKCPPLWGSSCNVPPPPPLLFPSFRPVCRLSYWASLSLPERRVCSLKLWQQNHRDQRFYQSWGLVRTGLVLSQSHLG